MLKFIAPTTIALLLLGACSTEMKQQRPPRIEGTDELSNFEDKGDDMQAEPVEDDSAVPVEKKELTEDERRMRCCEACADAREKDRSPDAAEKIPCADYTADLKNVCRNWFLDHPMTAAEAQACVKEAPKSAKK